MTVAYREGQMVRQGAPLVEIDPRPFYVQLQQAEAQLLKDQAALQNARIDLERYESLIAKNAIAQQILQTQRATVAQDEATLKTDQAAIDSAKLNLDYCHITAPISGRIGLRLVDPGNMVSAAANTPLLVITQTQPISVIFTIPEQQVAEVRAALKAGRSLRVDAMDRAATDVLASGELTTLDNQIDQTTGTLKLRATAPNRELGRRCRKHRNLKSPR
jgi:multidrug efflux system membrane fusion protein